MRRKQKKVRWTFFPLNRPTSSLLRGDLEPGFKVSSARKNPGQSAFFYHSLTDVIPDHYYLATKRSDTRIKDRRVHQSFMKDEIFDAGKSEATYNNSIIRIYDKERMLIELMRSRARIPLDYYKEVIQSYRKLSFELDFGLVEDYAAMFRNGAGLMEMIQMEVL